MTAAPDLVREPLPGAGILAVHAHPDDETLTHGATLAAWALAGQPVTLVTCTRGEAGEVIPAELRHLEGDGAALAEVREAELANAVSALGIDAHFFLDQLPPILDVEARPGAQTQPAETRYEDSGMVWLEHGAAGTAGAAPASLIAADIEIAAGRLAALIRKLRPSLLLTYEPGGGYGHPDHVRAREIAVRAAEIAADEAKGTGETWVLPAILGSVVPAAVLRAARDELARRHEAGEIPQAAGLRPETSRDGLPALARENTGGILQLDVSRPEVQAARARALKAHRTQVQAVVTFAPQEAAPYLSGAFGLSNNFYSPLFGRDFYLPDPHWSGRELTAADLVPVFASNSED